MNSGAETDYDVIVAGTGGVGSAALYHLSQKGLRVLGLDRFPAAHDRGSSHGETRVIRKAYFEHPNYVPLLDRAYDLWNNLEEETGEILFQKHDLLEIGPPDGIVVPGVLQAAREHDLKVESLTREQFAERFPSFTLPPDYLAVVEQDAGFLFVERCVRTHLRMAVERGALIQSGTAIAAWEASDDGVSVTMEDGTRHSASRLVITAGAWAGQLLNDLGLPLQITRKHLHWYQSEQSTDLEAGFPVFFYETADGFFYGFPRLDEQGIKVSEHSNGEVIDDPLVKDPSLDEMDVARIEQFLDGHIRGVSRSRTRHEVCMYTMSPDGDFIVDHHPDDQNVVFAAGLSGHGFKFASVLGEILADLATIRESPLPIEFLRLNRLRR